MERNRHISIVEKYRIRPLEADAEGRLKPGIITDLIQQAAWAHAVKLGVGTPHMISRGYTWMLTRLQLEIDHMPVYPGEVAVETWPSGTERLFTFRHFKIRDGEGRECARARSAWMVVDLSRMRAVVPPEFIKELPHTPEEGDSELYTSKLEIPVNTSLSTKIQVRKHDIDINEHVNNNMIIQWLYECLDEPGNLRTLDIRFKAECKLGDELLSEAEQKGREYIHRIMRSSDGHEIALARTTWS